MTFPTYEIRTVNDFLKIPTDRLEACLREFSTSLEIAKTIPDSEMPEWTWVDDGDEKQTVELVFRERGDGDITQETELAFRDRNEIESKHD